MARAAAAAAAQIRLVIMEVLIVLLVLRAACPECVNGALRRGVLDPARLATRQALHPSP